MPVISVGGKVATETFSKAPARLYTPQKSYLADLDHVQEIQDHLGFISDVDQQMQFLLQPVKDPWERAENMEQYDIHRLELFLHIGAVSAHLSYLIEGQEWETIDTLGMGMDPDILTCVKIECPGCLTGNWQYLAKGVCPF